MIVECLKQEGTSHRSRDLLKICVMMGASWSAQTLGQEGDSLSVTCVLSAEELLHIFFTRIKCRW